MPDFPIVFANLPTGLEPLALFDMAFMYARTPAYFLPNGVEAGTYGDTSHIPVITVDDAGSITSVHQVAAAGGGSGDTVIETGAGPFTVAPTTGLLILQKVLAGDTVINLGDLTLRGGLPLTISDWGGNAQTITVNPFGGQTIMGLPTAGIISVAQGVGTAGVLKLTPNTDLLSWVQI